MKTLAKVVFVLFLLSTVGITQSKSELQTIPNPWMKVETPAYPILNNLYFLSTTEGWIVGDLGTVLHTTDGGEHWNKIHTGVTTTLRTVFFSDYTIGYVGGDGILLRTKDGGNTWDITSTDFDIYDIYFKPAFKNMGYAVGSNGIILSTINYGDTWSETKSGNQTLNRIAFSSPYTGWVTGSAITTGSGTWTDCYLVSVSTTLPFINSSISISYNSGINWSNISSGNTLTDIQFINPNTAFEAEFYLQDYNINQVTDGSNICMYTPHYAQMADYGHLLFNYNINYYLFKTNDGWNTYSSHLIYSDTSATAIHPFVISFIDDSNGYATGIGMDKLFSTKDGGIHWSSMTTGYPFLSIERILFKTPMTGWIIGTQLSNIELGVILVTHDGGLSWTKQSSDNGFPVTSPLSSISFGLDSSGWLAGSGDQPVQFKTYDNGNTWYLVSTVRNQGSSIFSFNQDTAYILGPQLLVTTNGGMNWNSFSNNLFNGIGMQFTNTSTIWVWGQLTTYIFSPWGIQVPIPFPAIFQSIDKGSNWNVSYKANYAYHEISGGYFINESTGWVCLNLTIYSSKTISIAFTNDGGNTWTEQYVPQTTSSMIYNDISFASLMTGWICDSSGELYYTNDGGSFWQLWGQLVNKSLNKIYFLSPQVGWVIGDGGVILQTIDGGENWQYLEPITSSNLNYIAFTPNGVGYIVGDNGTMLRLYAGAVAPTGVPKKYWELIE